MSERRSSGQAILRQLRLGLAHPRFEKDREDAVSSLLNGVLYTTLVSAGGYQVFQLIVGIDLLRITAVGSLFFAALAGLWMLRARRLVQTAWLVTSVLFAAACVSIWRGGELDAPGATTFLVLILMSAVTLDWRPSIFWALLSIAALALFGAAETQGWLFPVEPHRSASERWVIYSLHLVAAAWLVAHSSLTFEGMLGLLGQRSAALRDSEERLTHLVEQSPDVMVALDETGAVVDCSPALESVFGYRPESLLGRRFADLGVLGSKDLALGAGLFEVLLEGGELPLTEMQVLHRDGSPRWVEANTRVVRRADGRVRIYGVIRDTTARHEAADRQASLERQLVEARRLEALGRLAGGVAHDFNNLLLVVLSNAELLEKETAGAKSELVKEIQSAAEAAADLTAQLLAFSGQSVPGGERVDVGAAFARVDRLLRRVLPANVELEMQCDEDLDLARGDPAQLEQVFVNLVMNAQQAMPDGGRIRVGLSNARLGEDDCESQAAADPGPYVRLVVSDEGRGMDEATQQQVFEPFFTQREGGTGLGLATVHGIVTQLGGHVRVCSAPGEGATFEVFLPVASEPLPLAEKVDIEPALPGEITVLVVDDDGAVLSAVSRLLERWGFEVLSAESADQAVAISRAEDGRIHLLVTDVLMPGPSGSRLARQLAEERPDMQVLLMSGYTPEKLSPEELEGFHFVTKPFSAARLRRHIAELVGDPASPAQPA